MRVVVDTNSLESDELRIFLNASTENLAVLPEHTNAEMFKHATMEGIFASHSVLRDFPKQVLVLRANRVAAAVDPKASAISNRFVDKEATRQFPQFCKALIEAEQGKEFYLRQFRKRQQWAKERADQVEEALGDQSEALAEFRQLFTENDLKQLRTRSPLTPRSRTQILRAVLAMSQQIAASRPGNVRIPLPPHRYYVSFGATRCASLSI